MSKSRGSVKRTQKSASLKKTFPRVKISKTVRSIKKVKQKKRKFVCEKCEENFLAWWDIREHWQSTGHKDPEQCRWCGKKTYALQSHLCKEHWDVASMCQFCGQLFMFKESLEKHLLSHDGKEYRCFLCGRRRKTEELMRAHISSHYVHEKYGCNVCEKRFKKKKNMENHLIQIHFICQYCGHTSENKAGLSEHLKVHDDLKCVYCFRVFSQKNRLKYHYQLQHGHQDFYKCTLCFQRFPIKARLLDHLKLKHNGVAKYSCETCDIPFLYWSTYINHFEKVHARLSKDYDKFSCSFCDFTTTLKSKLQWHVEKTSGNGFFCKKCQIRLQCKGRFDKHMEIHKGEQQIWTCDYCDRICKSDDMLSHHMSLIHKEIVMAENPRGHPCLEPDCDKYYKTKSSLARHMRTFHKFGTCSDRLYCADTTVVCETPLIETKRLKLSQEKDLEPEHISSSISSEFEKEYHHMVKIPIITEVNVYNCDSCKKFWFAGETQFRKHMNTHTQKVWDEECTDCDLFLESPEEAVRHYVEDHLKVEYAELGDDIKKSTL